MSRAVLHVPVPRFVELYRSNIGHRHLDVGPGTGYAIEKAAPPPDTEITLLDPNPHVLHHCEKRLAAYRPTLVEADVMKPLPVEGPFDSVALYFVIHCLRGPDANKAIAIRNIADVLEPEGVLFGGTILGLGEQHTKPARAFLRAANKQGGFDNLGDTADGLRINPVRVLPGRRCADRRLCGDVLRPPTSWLRDGLDRTWTAAAGQV